MTDEMKLKIIRRALQNICKFLRNNPPGDLSAYPPEMIQCLIGGSSDPDGIKYLNYFLMEAYQEINKEESEKNIKKMYNE